MGWPEIRTPETDSLQKGIHIGLPLKITGMVFWGLVVITLILVVEAMSWLERDLGLYHETTARHAILTVQALFDQNPDMTAVVLENQLIGRLGQLDISGLSVEYGIESIRAGNTEPPLKSYSGYFLAGAAPDTTESATEVYVTVWMPAIEAILTPQKKRLIIEMGLLVFGFGTILQLILQKLLTTPITQMVETARTCNQGGDSRFNESRKDEFGYLARFINRALDSLNHRQQELVVALDRARASEQALFDEKERAEVTLHSIAEGVITTDSAGRIWYLNPIAETLTGLSQTQATGKSISQALSLINEHDGTAVDSTVLECLRSDAVSRALSERILVRPDGEHIAIEETAAPIRDRSGKTIGAVLVFEDVRQTRELTRKLSYQASHDALTGLYNRAEFEMRLREALEHAGDKATQFTLCYMDLDQFKLVNDTCGHIAGDELLRQLANKLQGELRDSDTLARLGGDEFGVLLNGCSLEDASILASQLRKLVRNHHFIWDGKTFEVGVSIGVVPLSSDTHDVTEALSAADVACYAAKERGRNRVHVYEADDNEMQKKRGDMQWVSRIRQALKEDRFCLFEQPIVPVSSDGSGVSHHEVLLRMLDEEGKLLSPAMFMNASEQFGLMPEIDHWVIRNSIEWLGTNSGVQTQPYHLAINLSGQSLTSSAFLQTIIELFTTSGVNPKLVCFEITETAAIDNLAEATKFIHTLKTMGCKFALDDFGSGMSSFSYLKNLPVDYLKIDGSYVRDLVHDPVDRAMVEAVNQIGHAMGMKTIAEFVEDQATLGALAVIGVDFAQGYGIAKPSPLGNLAGGNVRTFIHHA